MSAAQTKTLVDELTDLAALLDSLPMRASAGLIRRARAAVQERDALTEAIRAHRFRTEEEGLPFLANATLWAVLDEGGDG